MGNAKSIIVIETYWSRSRCCPKRNTMNYIATKTARIILIGSR